ncbi:MAG TPA: hypothetical protein VN837_04295 [Chloroflexota bacterium]|nr:hypothetical protein [Chloroflexota bacterium]
MPRLRLIGELPQALSGGPIWEPGEERDLPDPEAAPYLTNANWRLVATETIDAPAPPEPTITAPASVPEEAT